ncbi:MAG TPA: hypothetical protein PL195_01135 [bacterium]|nr:hypothetical protein [bacterium]
MNSSLFWKNFNLGKELEISGAFIYNGLYRLHEIQTSYYDEEIFEVFYNLSVGLERLLKIAIILIEHDENMDQEKFEKSLISHNHLDLLKRVKNKHSINISTQHNELLSLLSNFYKNNRYGRYRLDSVFKPESEKMLLHSFLEKHLNIKIVDDPPFDQNNKFTEFIGKIVKKITTQLFEIISKEAQRLSIYTNEIKSNSKASKIFLSKIFTFENEDILIKELLVFFINAKKDHGLLEYIKKIKPLDFDSSLSQEYIQCFFSREKISDVLDELDALYSLVKNSQDRINALSLIGKSGVCFDLEEDKDCDDDL